MIAKAKCIAHCANAITYALNKKDAQQIYSENLAGENPNEIIDEFLIIQSQNNTCRNNTIRIEISPIIEKGHNFTRSQWIKIAQDYMSKMKLNTNRQWFAVLHNDREHRHLHIIANRIDFEGVAYNDSYILARSCKVGEELARERGLKTAMEIRLEKSILLKPIKRQILIAHSQVMRAGMPPILYQVEMRREGVEVIFNKSKTTGRITGMSYKIGDTKIKASDVDRRLGFNKLFKVYLLMKPIKPTVETTNSSIKQNQFSSLLLNSLRAATASSGTGVDLSEEEEERKKTTLKR